MKCKEIIKKIEEKYPVSFAEDWDNPRTSCRRSGERSEENFSCTGCDR